MWELQCNPIYPLLGGEHCSPAGINSFLLLLETVEKLWMLVRSKPTKVGHAFHLEKQFHYYACAYNRLQEKQQQINGSEAFPKV